MKNVLLWILSGLILAGTISIFRAPSISGATDEDAAAPMVQPESQPYNIVINIPGFRLRLYERGKLIKIYPVCAGMPGYRSPVRSGMKINRVLWNPSWGPPPGAAWAKNSHSKGPGKWNPVGLVKMPIKGYVFVHGTYKIKSLGFAWSHGCFRMANEDAVELAWLLQSHVGSNHPDQSLDYYRNSHRTCLVYLKQAVPVDIIYETVEVYDGKVFVHPDVYHRGTNTEERVIAKLNEAGWITNNDTSGVDITKIRRMIDRSPTETAIASRKDIILK